MDEKTVQQHMVEAVQAKMEELHPDYLIFGVKIEDPDSDPVGIEAHVGDGSWIKVMVRTDWFAA